MTYVSTTRNLVYISDIHYELPAYKMEHLSCFYPGLLSLGTELLRSGDAPSDTEAEGLQNVELPDSLRERHRWAAEAIAETCWAMYADNPTGLGSEEIVFDRPLLPETTPVSPAQDTLGDADTVMTPKTSRVYYVPVGVEHNRWWTTVDKWEANGRPGTTPPGIQGSDRKLVVTNGGKGSWEVYLSMYPTENEVAYTPPEVSDEEEAKDSRPKAQRRPMHLRTHLRDYRVRDGRWLMRPEVQFLT